MNITEILARCDHTLLLQTATWDEIRAICDDGMKYQTASVCIPPCYVKQAKEYVGDRLAICTVIGFPNGDSTTAVKCFETAEALREGADEIDMVIHVGDLKARPELFQKLGRLLLLGVFVAAHQGLFDAQMVQELGGLPGVLTPHLVTALQGLNGPIGDVPQVPDGGGDQVQHPRSPSFLTRRLSPSKTMARAICRSWPV